MNTHPSLQSPYLSPQKIQLFLLCTLLGLCLFLPILSGFNLSPTTDEPRHFYTGLYHLIRTPQLHSALFSSYSPPLEALNTIPALIVSKFSGIDLTSNYKKLWDYIFWARLVTSIYSVLLGYFVYIWSKRLFGVWAGLFSLSLYTFCPNIIAHSSLITTDTMSACFSFLWLYFFWRYSASFTLKNIFLQGLCFGFALMAKFTFIMYLPVYFAIASVLLFSSPNKNIFLKKFALSTLITFTIGTLILCASYRFELISINDLLRMMHFKSSFRLPINLILPFPEHYIRELFIVIEQSKNGHMTFLMGDFSRMGWWHYYIIAILIKTPIPTLIFFFYALFLHFKDVHIKPFFQHSFLLLPPIILICLASFQNVQIGLRHILGIYPFLFVFSGRVVQECALTKKYSLRICSALLAWLVLSCFITFPHYLSYFNEFIGGSKNGHKYLADSNLDWGQDVLRLKKFLEKRKIKNIMMECSASPTMRKASGISYKKIPSKPTLGYIAISTNKLYGFHDDNKKFSWLLNYKPVARIGNSIIFYHIQQFHKLNK